MTVHMDLPRKGIINMSWQTAEAKLGQMWARAT